MSLHLFLLLRPRVSNQLEQHVNLLPALFSGLMRFHAGEQLIELVGHGGWGVDWDELMDGEPQDQTAPPTAETCTEDKLGDGEAPDNEENGWTALGIAESRLAEDKMGDEEREELEKIRDLLAARRLPPGEEYLWLCMDLDFYEPRMPGAWDD